MALSTASDATKRVTQALDAFKARDRDHAADLLRQVLAESPDIGTTWGPLSRMAMAIGEGPMAVTAAERLAAFNPSDRAARLNHGQTLAQVGRGREAEAVGDALIAKWPTDAAGWHFRGICRAQRGESDSAIADFREAIRLSGESYASAASWLSLSAMKPFTDDDPDLERMERLRRAPLPYPESEDRAALLYALGKAYDDCGRQDDAFAAYSEGAASVRRLRGGSAKPDDPFVDGVLSSFTRAALDALPPSTISSDRPIFVLGLPRSGTTLVEQILVSHDDVAGGAELNLLKAAAIPVGGFSHDALMAFLARRPDGLTRIAGAYLGMLDQRFGASGRVVDKTLNHSRFLGLIHKTLPKARFIWVRRTPAAAAWSCFRTWFGAGMTWTWSLEDIGHHFRHEDRLYDHWRTALGDAVLTVDYETLVTDPTTVIDRMLRHVGLAPQSGLLDFHKSARQVATASFAQIKRPLYQSSSDAWRSYEARLEPFFSAYRG